jgi:HK97 gp10 family phage protein
MPDITMRVQGTAELRRALNRLRGDERRRAQQDGLEAGARIVETYAKVAAPVDTGALRNSIMLDEVTPERAILGPHVDYAEHVEFGTSRMAAQPYLRPAIDEHEAEILDAIEAAVLGFVESIG